MSNTFLTPQKPGTRLESRTQQHLLQRCRAFVSRPLSSFGSQAQPSTAAFPNQLLGYRLSSHTACFMGICTTRFLFSWPFISCYPASLNQPMWLGHLPGSPEQWAFEWTVASEVMPKLDEKNRLILVAKTFAIQESPCAAQIKKNSTR